MKKIIKLAVFLGVISVIASAALYVVNNMTAPIISANAQKETEKSLKVLYKDADKFESVDAPGKPVTAIYDAKKGDQVIGTVYEVTTYGFQSDVVMLLAINNDGKLNGMQVVSQAETPGYGTQITTNQDYIKQYSEKTVDDQIDTITGSTVTTSAVKIAVDEAIAHWKSHHNK